MKVPRERFEEVVQTWQKLPSSMRKCPNCERVLDGKVEDAWAENPKEAWMYVHCVHCGSDIALWKVARRWGKSNEGEAESHDA